MTNVKAFDVNSTIDKISDYAPIVLFIMMVVMFALTGWMQHHFLVGVFQDKFKGASYLVFLFPIVIQVLRFVTGFLSASFFKKGSWGFGLIVFLFSIWLSLFEYGEVESMATFWTTVDVNLKPLTHNDFSVSLTKEIIKGIMTVLIWGALILELFLAAWMGRSKKKVDHVNFSSNGAKKGSSKLKTSLS